MFKLYIWQDIRQEILDSETEMAITFALLLFN
jgi:hypothetical protein